jgi:hypothetical protein
MTVARHPAFALSLKNVSTEQLKDGNDSCLELNFERYQIRGASIGPSQQGSVYRCTCGHLSIGDLIDLEHAAETKQAVNLIFVGGQLLLLDVAVEHIEPGWVRVEGRVGAGS